MQPGAPEAGGPSPSPALAASAAGAAAGESAAPGLPAAAARARMENFRKVRTTEAEGAPPFPELPAGVVEMRVKEGSKIRNLMGFAAARMEAPGTRQIVFGGCGRAVTKAVTCVEILKRKVPGLHQVTKVHYRTLLEDWEDQDPRGRGQRLTVPKNVPAISILLSKDPLDPGQRGYQPPGPLGELWAGEGGSHWPERPSPAPRKGKRRRWAGATAQGQPRQKVCRGEEAQRGLGTGVGQGAS